MKTIIASASKEVVISPDHPFVVIGERINPTGRKVLAAQMKVMDMTRVRADALAQVEAGAQMLDVNAGVPDGDEPAIMELAVRTIQELTDAPLSLDSSVVAALESGLSAYRGKALVNSVTGEDERLEAVLPLVRKYDAAVIGIANDETGISMDPETRLAVARKIVERAADHGIPRENVIIDPLCMTVGADHNAGVVFFETMRLIRRDLGVNMVCGASNVSFGLPDRKGLNAAFLAMAMHAGLPCAITNPLEPEVHRTILAGDLLLGHDEYAMNWIQAFRERQAAEAQP
jgi:5-methyltetrahydrofolate--homocysteine methyltransferase